MSLKNVREQQEKKKEEIRIQNREAYQRGRSNDLTLYSEEKIQQFIHTYAFDFTYCDNLLRNGERDENEDIYIPDGSYTHTEEDLVERRDFAHGFLSLFD